jgi:hypothetical protein
VFQNLQTHFKLCNVRLYLLALNRQSISYVFSRLHTVALRQTASVHMQDGRAGATFDRVSLFRIVVRPPHERTRCESSVVRVQELSYHCLIHLRAARAGSVRPFIKSVQLSSGTQVYLLYVSLTKQNVATDRYLSIYLSECNLIPRYLSR